MDGWMLLAVVQISTVVSRRSASEECDSMISTPDKCTLRGSESPRGVNSLQRGAPNHMPDTSNLRSETKLLGRLHSYQDFHMFTLALRFSSGFLGKLVNKEEAG